MEENKTNMEKDSELDNLPCNLCGADNFKIIFNRPYNAEISNDLSIFVATTDEFNNYGRVVKCKNCGLVYTNPRPPKPLLEEGYTTGKDECYLSESSSRSINAHLSLNTIKRFVGGGKLLEIGSSVGYFLNAARLDFDITGFEPSKWACDIAKKRFKLDIFNSPFKTEYLPSENFDVISMVDVIEHLTDPKDTLKKMSGIIKPGGLLYIVTPDINGLTAKILRSYWWGLRPSHICYFTPKTLGKMLKELGFKVVLKKSYGRIFSLNYWASRLKNYPAFLRLPIEKLIDVFDLKDKLVYLDTRDTMEICAI
ncbi:MAG: class I SAM-dependent methyltransferase, partial [Elusimicrobia bacterium]|nr:class I SAM-dependent methyltransferase [Elusimicrobiota bacterium]